jgi:glutathione S-transferase
MNAQSFTLVSTHLCPFVQRAAIVLGEKGVAFERINVDLVAKPEWFLAISPTGKVPLLKVHKEDGSEVVLFESMAICEYLEETCGEARLYPEDALGRAQHRAWIEFASATLIDSWGFLNAKNTETAETKSAAFRGKLRHLEEVLSDGPYFAGEHFGMVDVAFAPVFRPYDHLDETVAGPLFAGLLRASAWRSALSSRPSVKAAVGPDFGDRLRAHMQSQQALLAT